VCERCPLEEETGTASDDNVAEDHSGESCPDDPPNISQESGDFRSEEQDSIITYSVCDEEAGTASASDSAELAGCGAEGASESPHATSTVKIVTHTATEKDAVVN